MKKKLVITIIALMGISGLAFAAQEGMYISDVSNQRVMCTMHVGDLPTTNILTTSALYYKSGFIEMDLGKQGNVTIPLTNNHGVYKQNMQGGEGGFSGSVNATYEFFVNDNDTIKLLGNSEVTLVHDGKSEETSCTFQGMFVRS